MRENVADLDTGIAHMQDPAVAQRLKLVSRTGPAKTARLAFALSCAERHGTVFCATTSNIVKLIGGLFQRCFEAVAMQHPGIGAEHRIVDNFTHRMVLRLARVGIVVAGNRNGGILSHIAAGPRSPICRGPPPGPGHGRGGPADT